MHLDGVKRFDPTLTTAERRDSAVLVGVIERDTPHLLFTKRADHLSNHPGQMSFPGGRREPEDDTLSETATREADEEICLDPDEADFVGRLDDIVTVTGFSVSPFVARVPDQEYQPCDDEVAEIAVLPVAALTDRDNYHGEYRDHPERGRIRVHYFYVDEYTVWGATARMLVQFLELTTDWTTPEVDEVVDADADYPL
ncbi:NUDIX domain-containing protein [Halovenus aranensis]|jgi:8-oxo-dGTP pyrophosphatase MutT (NUDIX family)|uniref:NUDIX domain-containing protein n=1 Tax=Halovenus aranensis TaxID=890420 RepID=A0A1G8WHG4_9EURY|nr:CoA pyrophosphatase [Halovenus aranensis]SDJ77557.1 NUDIX domain-containing protein [Halovenus aranensis]